MLLSVETFLLAEEAVRAFFESLEMGAADAWTLFASLDADGDNVISISAHGFCSEPKDRWLNCGRPGLKDFTERCIQLHGPARSVDLYALAQQNATGAFSYAALLMDIACC